MLTGSSRSWGVAACVGLTLAVAVIAQPQSPPSLSTDWPVTRLKEVLKARDSWRPIPVIGDRERWAGLSPRLRDIVVRQGEKAKARPIAPLEATLFLEYARNGNRSRFEAAMFGRRDRLHALVLAECVEDKGRFLDAIADTAWAISEESSWTVPAHQGAQKAGIGLADTDEPVVDLFAAQTAHSFAWTLYLLGDRLDKVSPLLRPRLAREVDRRVLTPYLTCDDFWWMGFAPRATRPNNWNPWINSNVIAAALLVEPLADRRAAIVHKALRSLDRYLGPHPRDGSCDEGPAYWTRAGASLFESLELLHSASSGRLDVFAEPVVRDIGRFIYRVRIGADWFVNIGDADARVNIDRGLAFRYGKAIGDPLLQALGASGATEDTLALDDRSIGRTLFSLFGWEAMAAARDATSPLVRDAWLPSEDLQMMTARDKEGSALGFFVAAWAGHNNQSHNHNDVGNAVVFVDGEPVLVDAGRPTYTSQTFGNRRYEIWAMQSAFHNLPTVNGAMQAPGREAAAANVTYKASQEAAELGMDIAPSYPKTAGLTSWVRTVRLNRGHDVVIGDRFELARPSQDIALHLMTPCEAVEKSAGVLQLTCGRIGQGAPLAITATFDGGTLAAHVERIALDDANLVRSWGDHLNRITLTARRPLQKGAWALTLTR